jgi:AcrR family transcriptional regulator
MCGQRVVAARIAGAVKRAPETTPRLGAATRRRWRCARTASAAGSTRGGGDVRARGYATHAESVAREAGMSKATFYEHFENKEDCILALFDDGATRRCSRRCGGPATPRRERRLGARARGHPTLLEALAAFPTRPRRCWWR